MRYITAYTHSMCCKDERTLNHLEFLPWNEAVPLDVQAVESRTYLFREGLPRHLPAHVDFPLPPDSLVIHGALIRLHEIIIEVEHLFTPKILQELVHRDRQLQLRRVCVGMISASTRKSEDAPSRIHSIVIDSVRGQKHQRKHKDVDPPCSKFAKPSSKSSSLALRSCSKCFAAIDISTHMLDSACVLCSATSGN